MQIDSSVGGQTYRIEILQVAFTTSIGKSFPHAVYDVNAGYLIVSGEVVESALIDLMQALGAFADYIKRQPQHEHLTAPFILETITIRTQAIAGFQVPEEPLEAPVGGVFGFDAEFN